MNSSPKSKDSNRRGPRGKASRWFKFALGSSLAVIGGFFIWLMARSFLRAWEMRSWPEVPCVILSSEIEERHHDSQSPVEYRVAVSFGYEWQGTRRTADHLSLRGSPWLSDRAAVTQRADQYPVGKRLICRVPPQEPDSAVLEPDSLAPGYSIWFPALFAIAGVGIAVSALRPARDGEE